MKTLLTSVILLALVALAVPPVHAADTASAESVSPQAEAVAGPAAACALATSTTADSGSERLGGYKISEQRCTADDCERCNDNGLQCVPEDGECFCDPWVIIVAGGAS